VQVRAPLDILFDVNSVCQLRCRYCSAMPFDGSQAPRERTLALLEEMGALGVWNLTFSGGEPLLHPHILEFIQKAFEGGIRPRVNTNGLKLLDGELLDNLLRLQEHGVLFDLWVSLDSADPAANDRGRGRGIEVSRAIRTALQKGLRVGVAAVVHKGSLQSALDLRAAYPDVQAFSFFPMVATWAARERARDLETDREEMRRFWQAASVLQAEQSDRCTITLPFRRDGAAEQSWMRTHHRTCYCGFVKAYIDSHLTLYPCSYTRAPGLCLGDLNVMTIAEAWNGAEAARIRARAQSSRLCEVLPTRSGSSALPVRYRVVRDTHEP
jgi:MoaA/NifB/PqqE/SkfB family radical SAM enzyme